MHSVSAPAPIEQAASCLKELNERVPLIATFALANPREARRQIRKARNLLADIDEALSLVGHGTLEGTRQG